MVWSSLSALLSGGGGIGTSAQSAPEAAQLATMIRTLTALRHDFKGIRSSTRKGPTEFNKSICNDAGNCSSALISAMNGYAGFYELLRYRTTGRLKSASC